MDTNRLHALLSDVQDGQVSVEDALEKLKRLPFQDLGFARLDTHRALRNGMPEVIFCQGKTSEQITEIFKTLKAHHGRVFGTRATPEQAAYVTKHLPGVNYDPTSRILGYEAEPQSPPKDGPFILVATGGTSDLPVAEEAAQVAEFLGNRVVRAFDVGVAGVHRLLNISDTLMEASVIIAVAGMEGALATVIGGLVACPVIAVPTSVGYGANFGGIATLLAMLNSCATGIAVVNIDNGFGAATFANLILNQAKQIKTD